MGVHHMLVVQLLAYGLPKETLWAIIMLYRNTKAKVSSPDGDTGFFNIVAASRYIRTIFVYNLPRLHTSNIDKSNKTKWLYIKKEKKARSRRYL